MIALILETIDKFGQYKSRRQFAHYAGEDSAGKWDDISSYLYLLLGKSSSRGMCWPGRLRGHLHYSFGRTCIWLSSGWAWVAQRYSRAELSWAWLPSVLGELDVNVSESISNKEIYASVNGSIQMTGPAFCLLVLMLLMNKWFILVLERKKNIKKNVTKYRCVALTKRFDWFCG